MAPTRGQGLDTTYFFEIGTDTALRHATSRSPPADAGVENGPQQVDPIPVDNLQGETEYHYRACDDQLPRHRAGW